MCVWYKLTVIFLFVIHSYLLSMLSKNPFKASGLEEVDHQYFNLIICLHDMTLKNKLFSVLVDCEFSRS